MSNAPINDPQYWRDRAEAARTLADELTGPDSKRRMLRIAQDFEELARRAEQRLARKP
jgi:predicted Rossmann-fold nucleotide-binding protein